VITYNCMPERRDWDGRSYDRISGPMEALALAVLDRLPLEGDETVLDVGCGSGRVTEAILDRLPRGRVIALDANASMVAAASERLARYIDNGLSPSVEMRLGDVLEAELPETVDAVFSTATFHWIADHERLFGRLRAALRPGGRLVAQCGGEGNITGLRGNARQVIEREPYAELFADFEAPWNYAGAEQTSERVLAAGFSSAECWLEPAPKEPEQPREFLSTIVLGPHVQHLPEELRDPFMDEVLELLGEPVVVDYVRLNIDAVA
jgi:trans-aconitate 2-methyltransferase